MREDLEKTADNTKEAVTSTETASREGPEEVVPADKENPTNTTNEATELLSRGGSAPVVVEDEVEPIKST